MSNINPNNPFNDPTLQMLLDLEQTILSQKNVNSELLNSYYDFFGKLKKEKTIIHDNSVRFNQHRYNDKKMHFIKMQDFNHSQCFEKLSANAGKILIHMTRSMSQQNKIIVKIKVLTEKLNLSQNPIRKGLAELEENGCITKIHENKKNGFGTVYMINPNIACKSKHERALLEEFYKITPEIQLFAFAKLDECISSAIPIPLPIANKDDLPNQTILCNQVVDKIQLKTNITTSESQDDEQNYTDISTNFDDIDINMIDEEVDNLFSVNQ